MQSLHSNGAEQTSLSEAPTAAAIAAIAAHVEPTIAAHTGATPVPGTGNRFAHRVRRRARTFVHDMVQVALPALLLAIVVHLFLAQATIVFGQSMEPNLSPHQRLIVDKLSFRLHAPARNDIVVVDLLTMDDMLVKRVVGLPGETIEVSGGRVLVNGQPLPEPFPHDLGNTTMAPLILGPLEYFVMGDNRDNSNDSRSFGPVHRESIVGRVWLRYWPLDQFHLF